MPFFTDQLDRTIHLAAPPKRIVSLVPSQTELLHAFGLEKEVVGITKFCVHPQEWFRQKTRIGGTKNVHHEKIAALQPDLIIANKEENVQEQIESLAEQFPVWVSDVTTLTDACNMIQALGSITGKAADAKAIVEKIRTRFSQIQTPYPKPRMTYLIWKDPYMTVGGDTFIHHMLENAGFQNCFASGKRYPVVTVEDIRESECEVLLLSSEPYPFKEKHVTELGEQLPGTRILLVDGEMFSWYGSRLLEAPSYFHSLQLALKA